MKTKIHGKYYDLTHFKHPGGDEPIELTNGIDSTIMFESHHPFVPKHKLADILKKYECQEEDMHSNEIIPDGIQYEFNSPFALEIKNTIGSYFLDIAKKKNITLSEATKADTLWSFLIPTQLLATVYTGYYFYSGYYSSLIPLSILLWLNSRIGHEAGHFAISRKPIINSILKYVGRNVIGSSFVWKLHHNVGHHANTNVLMNDPDNHLYDVIGCRVSPYFKYNIILKIQHYLISSLFMGSGIFNISSSFIYIFTNRFHPITLNSSIYRKMTILLETVVYIIMFLILPYYLFPIDKAILFIIIPCMISSSLFYVNSHVTHIHEHNMVSSNDWYKHQALTASNHSLGSTFGFYFSGGLNYQIEHHLFPGVNHCHFPYIHKEIMAICEKHGVWYKAYDGYTDAFTDYYNWLKRLGNDPTLYRAT